MDEYLGIIKLFAGNFAPRGWEFCNGELLQISQNQALFSILGTIYGGDGRTTFALPDLRGRVPAHCGQGIGLQPILQGQELGINANILTIAQLPVHSHLLNANASASGRSLSTSPANNYPAQNQDGTGNYAGTCDVQMNSQAIGTTGGNTPVNNMQPTLGLNYIICVEGLYPQRP